jgi:hypothetical protein
MLSCNLGRQSASSSSQRSNHARVATCRRRVVVVRAFQQAETDRPAAAAVQRIAPSSNLHTYEQAIVTFGQVRVTPTAIGDHFSFMQLVLLLKVCSRYLLPLAPCHDASSTTMQQLPSMQLVATHFPCWCRILDRLLLL